ncbi:transposase [Escherichia coli]|nr:transposase [Escherichia coli]
MSGVASMSGIPGGGDGGLTTAERQRLKELERENRELRRSNDILRQASVGNNDLAA